MMFLNTTPLFGIIKILLLISVYLILSLATSPHFFFVSIGFMICD
jgi:hypothetical protein